MSEQFMKIMALFFMVVLSITIPTIMFQSFVGLLIVFIVLLFVGLCALGAWLFARYLGKHHIDLNAWLAKVRRNNERKTEMHFSKFD